MGGEVKYENINPPFWLKKSQKADKVEERKIIKEKKKEHFSELKDQSFQIAKPSSVQPFEWQKTHRKAQCESLEPHGEKHPKTFQAAQQQVTLKVLVITTDVAEVIPTSRSQWNTSFKIFVEKNRFQPRCLYPNLELSVKTKTFLGIQGFKWFPGPCFLGSHSRMCSCRMKRRRHTAIDSSGGRTQAGPAVRPDWTKGTESSRNDVSGREKKIQLIHLGSWGLLVGIK